MSRPVAVVGVGQTKHAARRSDHSIMGLVREAVDRALVDAGLEHKDIDAVVIGKAPDMLEGVAQPEQGRGQQHAGEQGHLRPHALEVQALAQQAQEVAAREQLFVEADAREEQQRRQERDREGQP